MTKHKAVAGLVALLVGCAAQTPARSQGAVVPPAIGSRVFVFENVSVIPMDAERILTEHSVVIEDGRIVMVAPTAATSLPEGATRVDGRGKFLIPGLAEMHGHLPPGQAPAWAMPQYLTLFVANGITTVRGMLGAPNQLETRKQIESGALLGPTLFLSAPSLNGKSAPDAATAERLIREHKAAGYDFLKLHPGLKPEVYDRIVQVARELDLTWAGHVSVEVGIEKALATGQSTVDHLDGYLEASGDEALRKRVASPTDMVPFADIIAGIRKERIAALAKATKEAGTWTVPTMLLFERFFSFDGPLTEAQLPELKYVSEKARNDWAKQTLQIQEGNKAGVTAEQLASVVQFRRDQLRAIAEAGGGILMGSDAPQVYSVPGFSIARETQAMVAAGMTPYQVLQSGSSAVAKYVAEELKGDANFGTIEEGKRADLILLDHNPLEDIGALRAIQGVMLRGKWLPRTELDRLLAEIETAHAAPAQP